MNCWNNLDNWVSSLDTVPHTALPIHFSKVLFQWSYFPLDKTLICSLPVRTSLNFSFWYSMIRFSLLYWYLSNLFSQFSSQSITPGSLLHACMRTQVFFYLCSFVYSPSMFSDKTLSFLYLIFPISLKYIHFLLYFDLTTCNAHLIFAYIMFYVQIDEF